MEGMDRRLLIAALTGVVLGVSLAGAASHAAPGSAPVARFDAGRFLLSDALEPPPESAAWQPVTLTDLWRETRPGAGGRGWYRFEFDLDAVPDERWAVYLPGLASNAAAFVNGERVGDGGSMEPPVALNSNRPLLFSVSPRSLRTGTNRLDVALYAHVDSWDRLEPLWVGPASLLVPRYERQHFWHVDVARFATGLVLAMLLFIGAIWLGSRREPVYGWFLATAGFWSIASFNYHIRDLPLPFHDWERLVHFSLGAAAASGLMLAMRLVGLERPRIERAVLAGVALFGVALVVTPIGSIQQMVRVVHIGALALLVSTVIVVARHRRLLQEAELPLVLIGAAAFLAVASHDLAIQFELLPMDQPRLMPLGGPLILGTFVACLTARFLRASRRVARLNVELEERAAESEQALAKSYGRMAELEKDRALSRERARILREVHDGMGGKIVSSLALLETEGAEQERIAETLRESLDDMRLLMHSLHPDAGDLDALLGLLRDRLEARLEGTGVTIEWRPGDLAEEVPLSPEQGHNVGRIVEEAFTNVLKHAGASRVRVSTELAARDGVSHVILRVSDDGRARAPITHEGHGLRHMRERAEAIGGHLEVDLGEDGSEVRLWVPLPSGQREEP